MSNDFSKNLSLQACLGLGSFGIVFAAQHRITKNQYALKLVPKDATVSTKEQLELDRESQLTRDLPHHRNVVRVFDVVENSYTYAELETLWDPNLATCEDQHERRDAIIAKAKRHGTATLILFQMEICGQTLRHWLQDEETQRMEANVLHPVQFKIVHDFSEGIRFLHSNNIIHRDIKPENAMFSPPSPGYGFPLKIGDFGLCRICHTAETKTSSLTSKVGTSDYRAPEVSRREYGKQCDIYSFRLVTWEVIQLIPSESRRHMFDALVNDRDQDLITEHPGFLGVKDTIIAMTMRGIKDRMASLDDFTVEYIDTGPGSATRGDMFDGLKNDQDCNTIKQHSVFARIKQAVINITMRKPNERMRTVDDNVEHDDSTSGPTMNRSLQGPTTEMEGDNPGTIVNTPRTPLKRIVVALYPFMATDAEGLSLETGEEYEIIDDTQGPWWQVKNKIGDYGYIPSNYVKEKELLGLQQYE